MLGDKERDVLNHALEKYRPGRSAPVLIGGAKALKPALQMAANEETPVWLNRFSRNSDV